MSLDYDICNKCHGYILTGTYAREFRDFRSRCHCDDEQERADLTPKLLPNGRHQVAA